MLFFLAEKSGSSVRRVIHCENHSFASLTSSLEPTVPPTNSYLTNSMLRLVPPLFQREKLSSKLSFTLSLTASLNFFNLCWFNDYKIKKSVRNSQLFGEWAGIVVGEIFCLIFWLVLARFLVFRNPRLNNSMKVSYKFFILWGLVGTYSIIL